MRCSQLQNALRIADGGIHFQPVADDSGVREKPGTVGVAIGRDNIRIETAVCPPERLSLLEDREPGESGLIDLQHQPLEQLGIAFEWKAILAIMIGSMPFMSCCGITVGLRHSTPQSFTTPSFLRGKVFTG